jgi:hypothetical protein
MFKAKDMPLKGVMVDKSKSLRWKVGWGEETKVT